MQKSDLKRALKKAQTVIRKYIKKKNLVQQLKAMRNDSTTRK